MLSLFAAICAVAVVGAAIATVRSSSLPELGHVVWILGLLGLVVALAFMQCCEAQ